MRETSAFLLFGATGDLARRMLWPSLYGLAADRFLPPDLRVVGTAHTQMDSDAFRDWVRAALMEHVPARRLSPDRLEGFLRRVSYVPLDVSAPGGLRPLAEELGGPVRSLSIMLSMAPSLFGAVVEGLNTAGLAGDHVRLALEKPLGSDLATSRRINDAVRAAFPEERTFRIDHYLGKETVQNLLALRFGNALFEPLWNFQGIDHVQITVAETVGVEGRTSYFDGMGSLRDMVQNHMLQLLALVAMEAPARFAADEVRDEKLKVLRSLRPLDARRDCVIGQYEAGSIQGQTVPAYRFEVGADSATETFVALKVHVDNWRWRGVPFYLRTGKRLPERRSEIIVHFRPVPHSIFEGSGARLRANRLVISLQPEEDIRLAIMTRQTGLDRDGIRLREVPLNLGNADALGGVDRRIAYERLLLDVIEGHRTLFVRRDEVEAQWEWIDAVRRGWSAAGMTPTPYAAGSWGPPEALALTARSGAQWHD